MPTLEEMYKIIQTKGSSGIEEIENKDIQAIATAVRKHYEGVLSVEVITETLENNLFKQRHGVSIQEAAKAIHELVK
jgi:predicted nucleic acid-binding protein